MDAVYKTIVAIPLRWRLLITILLEFAYMAASRAVPAFSATMAQAEINRTPLRLVVALLFWVLMRDVILAARASTPSMQRTLLAAVAIPTLATPLLVGGYDIPLRESLIMMITSIPVGFAEELFFRGILQNLAIKRWGFRAGLALTVVCFVAFHVGVTNGEVFNYLQIALTAIILGVLYFKTASIFLVIALHAAYDVIDSLPRLFAAPDRLWGLTLLVPVTFIALLWAKPKT